MHCMLRTANVFTISTEMYNEIGTIFWYKMSVTLIRQMSITQVIYILYEPSLPECNKTRVGRIGAFNAIVKMTRRTTSMKLNAVHDGADNTDNSQKTEIGNDLKIRIRRVYRKIPRNTLHVDWWPWQFCFVLRAYDLYLT